MHLISSAVSHFPHTAILASCQPAHTLFLRCEQIPMLCALEGCSKNLFAEPCGLKDTHGTVLHVHRAVISNPNERAQTREHFSNLRKIYPSGGLFLRCEPKKAFKSRSERQCSNFIYSSDLGSSDSSAGESVAPTGKATGSRRTSLDLVSRAAMCRSRTSKLKINVFAHTYFGAVALRLRPRLGGRRCGSGSGFRRSRGRPD